MSNEENYSHQDLPALRIKRGSKKRGVTKVAKFVLNVEKTELQHWHSLEINTQLCTLDTHCTAYETIQDQIIGILHEEERDKRLREEEKEFEDQAEYQQDLRKRLNHLLAAAQAHERELFLEQAIQDLESVEDLTGHSVKDALDALTQDLRTVQRTILNPACPGSLIIQQSASSLSKRIYALKEKHDKGTAAHVRPLSLLRGASEGHGIRLPKIDLPTFHGDIMEWQLFWDSFCSILRKDVHLEDSDKLFYLRSAMCCEEGKSIVNTATGCGSDYSEIVEALKMRFDRRRLTYKARVKQILQHRVSSLSSKELRHSIDFWRAQILGLRKGGQYELSSFLTAIAELSLDDETYREWSIYSEDQTKVPDIEEFIHFMEKRIASLPEKPRSKQQVSTNSLRRSFKAVSLYASDRAACPQCKSTSHSIYQCSAFKELPVERRISAVQTLKLCNNCLGSDHFSKECRSHKSCRECGKRHHSYLHKQKAESQREDSLHLTNPGETSVLMTSLVIAEAGGRRRVARVLLDSGSTISLVTNRFAQELRAKRISANIAINALSESPISSSKSTIGLDLKSMHDETLSLNCQAAVVKSITCDLPRRRVIDLKDSDFLKNIQLADPSFDQPGKIDILLGSPHCLQVLTGGTKQTDDGRILAKDTWFGWAVAGKWDAYQSNELVHICCQVSSTDDQTHQLMRQFWEIENAPTTTTPLLSVEDEQALKHFDDTIHRDDDGRYVVQLPKKLDSPLLGCSREQAMRRFRQNQVSLIRKGQWDAFDNAVNEYSLMDHAEPVPERDLTKPEADTFYLPMHGVSKETSTTTKLRVVFDASAKTSTGISLNDTLMRGPTLYPLLTSVLNKFRRHSIGMSSDISKMFREVSLHEQDRDLHRFLKLDPTSNLLQDWRMTRVTFGVICSPFLATQVLRQVAKDHKDEFPVAAEIVNSTIYVDDCLTGAETVEQATLIREELNGLLSKACMTLRKWRSNSPDLLQTVPEDMREQENTQLISSPSQCQKALGVHWHTSEDTLHVSTPTLTKRVRPTKRQIASDIARTFDVLGWFSPSTIKVKVLLQQLWQLQIDWDDPAPPELAQEWENWRKDVQLITDYPIPRCLHHPRERVSRQLHGFADASQTAYAGVIYLRTMYADTTTSVALVMAKTRVAPLHTQSIPRLELCAALLLSQLLQTVMADMEIDISNVFAWSDSTITLGWIRTSPPKLKTFVSNRVAKIIEILPPAHWRHVPTDTNPADPASRGISTAELLENELWWTGPPWLNQPPEIWPARTDFLKRQLPEVKAITLHILEESFDLIDRYSSYQKLLRITAWCRRFVSNTIGNDKHQQKQVQLSEVERAEETHFALSQQRCFPKEVALLQKRRALPAKNSLNNRRPYLDQKGLIRVGGRLANSKVKDISKHPIILHGRDHLMHLMIFDLHYSSHHAGPTTLLGLLSTRLHVIGAKRAVRKVTDNCMFCKRFYARTAGQLMGQLPSTRLTPAPPFTYTGADFAGPITLKKGHTRRPVKVKGYICIFVCLSTKAVHIEPVTDLTAEAFLASLKRFVARRGCPEKLMTDNGLNFVGANNQLADIYRLLTSSAMQTQLNHFCIPHKIEWSHTPGRAPHFGGIWEAAVKVMKSILYKTVGAHVLDLEELYTVLAGVEATMNSRPLTPIDSTPTDGIEALTPGHFLVGRPLLALPERRYTTDKIPNLRRWNLCQKLGEEIWDRWSHEYLQLLQRHNKWKQPQRNLQVGDVVLIKDQELFQRSWPLALVEATHAGSDNLVRVATVRTTKGSYKRPVHKLVVLLPIEEDGLPLAPGGCSGLQETAFT